MRIAAARRARWSAGCARGRRAAPRARRRRSAARRRRRRPTRWCCSCRATRCSPRRPPRPDDPPAGAALRLRRLRVGRGPRRRAASALRARARGAVGGRRPAATSRRVDGRAPARGRCASTEAFAVVGAARASSTSTPARCASRSRCRARSTRRICACPSAPAFAGTLAPDFRVGAGIGGDLGALAYAAAVMSPTRTLDGELFDRGALVAVRLAAEPIGPVGIDALAAPRPTIPGPTGSASAAASRSSTARCSRRETLGAGADLSAQWRRFVATAEYIFLHAPSGESAGRRDRAGRHAVRAPARPRRARRMAARRRARTGGAPAPALTALRARSARPPAGRLRAPHRPRARSARPATRSQADVRDRLSRPVARLAPGG